MWLKASSRLLVALEYVSCIDFVYHIVETTVVPISNNRLTLLFKLRQIIHHLASEERFAIGNRGLVDDDLGNVGVDAIDDAPDGAMADGVEDGLHGDVEDKTD